MENASLVSCIMPTTAARRHFLPLAIQRFLAQDYPNLELVILDDTDGICPAALPEDTRIRYERASRYGLHTGGKRNEACSLAKGDIIVHLDDDDWYTHNWVSRQVSHMEATGAAICGLNKLLFYAPLKNMAWTYTYLLDRQPWVAGATMAYRRSLWEKRPFDDIQIGEDNNFIWHCDDPHAFLPYMEGFVAIIHPGNTSVKNTTSRAWATYPAEAVAGMLADQYSAYQEKNFFT